MNNALRKRICLLFAAIFLALAVSGCSHAGEKEAVRTEPDSPEPVRSEPEIPELQAKDVVIRELAAANTAGLRDSDGDFSDWIELENTGEETANLSGCWLSDSESDLMKWQLPECELAPGSQLLIFASGKNRAGPEELHTNFSLTKNGESLYLSAPDGRLIDSVSWQEAAENHSLSRGEEGQLTDCVYPTPGCENSYEAWLSLCAGDSRNSSLMINEVMCANKWFLPQNGEYYDWVELKNVSRTALDLSEYYLSDDEGDYLKYRLPEIILSPGEYCVLLCTDTEPENSEYPTVPFKLDSKGEKLFLSHRDRVLCDWCVLERCLYGDSIGRSDGENGLFFFKEPSPGEDNTGGARSYAQMPQADVPSGVYEAGKDFSVCLSGEGEIRYTLDGSVPDENSSLYTGPVPVKGTTVIRAVSCQEGRYNSRPLTLSYILEADETMDVVSLVADPEEFLGDEGLYYGSDKTREVSCSVSFFEEGGGFTSDGGITLHGNSELTTRGQKGLQLNFRDSMGGCPVYDLFGETKEQHSLVLRSGISREYYFVADVLYTELAQGCCSSLMSQDWRYVSVYVNGQYWGLYQLRDRFSRDYFAELWDVPKESVDIVRATELYDTELGELIGWVYNASLQDEENYQYLAERMDMESLAEWFIIQAYSGNTDHRTNVKWVKSDQYDGKWHILLYDVDRPMLSPNGLVSLFQTTAQGINELRMSLFQNESFKALMLSRMKAMLSTELTTENTLEKLDQILLLVDGQMQRSLLRWGYDVSRWETGVEELKTAIAGYDLPSVMIYSTVDMLGLSREETGQYFHELLGE